MKISIISIPYNNTCKSITGVTKPEHKLHSYQNNKINFESTYAENELRARQTLSKQRRERIRELDDSEYKKIMDEMIEHQSDIDCRYKSLTDHFIDLSYCENIPFEFMGIIPYCGYESSAHRINKYLLGVEKQSSEVQEQKNADYISALNYSIDKVDEKYGKFEGYTYRRGHFSPNGGRFYSTGASVPETSYLYNYLDDGRTPEQKVEYNIIKLKNGHRINSLLNDYALSRLKDIANQEDLILIDTKSKFRFVPEEKYNKEISKEVANYYDNIIKLQKNDYSKDELKKKIKISVWEEI